MKLVMLSLLLMVTTALAAEGQGSRLSGSDWKALKNAMKPVREVIKDTLPPSWWDRTVSSLVVHDALNSVEPKYRTYAPFSYTTSLDRRLVAEASGIFSFQKYAAVMAKRAEPGLNPQQIEQLKLALVSFSAVTTGYLAAYSNEVRAEAERISDEVTTTYFEVLRRNDMGSLTSYEVSEVLGQFRMEPDAVVDNYLPLVGAKTFAVCNSEALFEGLLSKVPAFDDRYVKDLEEVRCYGRADDGNGHPEQGPGCAGKTSIAQLEENAVGDQGPGIAAEAIKAALSVHRDYSFADAVRLDAVQATVIFDDDVMTWTLRHKVNHWRPVSAIHSGLGPQTPAGLIEKDWKPRSLWAPEFPDYPSGSQAGYTADFVVINHVLNEDPLHQNLGGAISTIDGHPFSLVMKGTYTMDGKEIETERAVIHTDEILRLQGTSRIMAGDHFRFSVEAGHVLGERVANQLWAHGLLAPIGGANDSGASYLGADLSVRHCGTKVER